MRALMLIFLAFALAFLGALGGVLYSQGLLGDDGVMLLVRPPKPTAADEAKAAIVPAAPLAQELQAELKALEDGKAALEREREQLAIERESLERQRDTLAEDLAAIEKSRESLHEEQAANTKALSQMLANMDADAAARIIENLPQDTAVAVLLLVKQRESGAIMEALPPTVAATLSERIVEWRRANSPKAG